jgi:hypothetical protein
MSITSHIINNGGNSYTILNKDGDVQFRVQSGCIAPAIIGFVTHPLFSHETSGIFQICHRDQLCDYILKIFAGDVESVRHEIDLTRFASNLEVGSEVYDSWTCLGSVGDSDDEKTIGFLDMQMLDCTLEQYQSQYPDRYRHYRELFINRVQILVNRLHDAGIAYVNFRPQHVLLKLNGQHNPVDLRLIDYRMAYFTSDATVLDADYRTNMIFDF